MKKILYVLSMIALFVVVTIVLPMMPGWLYTDVERIDRDFKGIYGGDTIVNVAPASDSQPVVKTIHLLVIHGIGRHCIGYADGITTGIARYVKLVPGKDEAHIFPEQCGKKMSDGYNDFEYKQTKDCELIQAQGLSDRNCQRLTVKSTYTDEASKKSKTSMFFPGYIRTQDYKLSGHADGAVRLRLYELTWDPTTRWAKNYYVMASDDNYNQSRLPLNLRLKQRIINESISDAVLYLGRYRPMMQYPILMSLCKVLSEAVDVPGRGNQVFTCDLQKVLEEFNKDPEFFETNEVVIMTHSLGTRMLFDTLGLIGHENFLGRFKDDLTENGISIDVPEGDMNPEVTEPIRNMLSMAISKVFTLANQVPLLELGTVTSPTSFNLDSDLGSGFNGFLKRRINNKMLAGRTIPPLQLVAFTDPNDLLSYNLKCWYYLRVLRYHDEIKEMSGKSKEDKRRFIDNYFKSCKVERGKSKEFENTEQQVRKKFWEVAEKLVRISDVTVNLKGIRYPLLFADPSGAHSQYFEDDSIFGLIACGGTSDPIGQAQCK